MSAYIPPKKSMHLLILMINYRIVTFKDQQIYENIHSFKNAMKQMRLNGLVEARRINGCMNEYKCTQKGQKLGVALYELAA